ncbi:hypothetical protein M433DRAFT_159635 [Acidomyces richmondensis BFW]|nr:MAG: hypothetical protein FE78DRAFT_86117 [Acidomyces sp. 'richmondensis']KYG40970.1 hypothetical protein M433DRAFT_159635 [Acidomyces richmondensis BFW]
MPGCMKIAVEKTSCISKDNFHKYWIGSHVLSFLGIPIVQQSIIKYKRFHIDTRVRDELERSGFPILEVDGIAEF